MLKQAFNSLRQIWNDEKGVALAYVAVLLIPMMGMAALAIDVSHAYFWRQQMQTAADAAAYSGELALTKSQNVMLNGKAVAGSFAPSFVTGVDGVTVTINCNDATALNAGYCDGAVTAGFPYSSDATAVEAIITRPVSATFANVFGTSSFSVGARAVARATPTKYCMLALDPTGAAIHANGNVNLGHPDCGVADNSASNPATDIKGGGTIYGPFTVNGAINTNGNNFDYPQGRTENTGTPVPDPYGVDGTGQINWVTGTAATWTASRTTWNTNWANSNSNWKTNMGNANSTFNTNWKANAPTCGKKNGNSPDCLSGSCSGPKYCTVTGTISTGTHYINALNAGGTLSAGSFYVQTIAGGTFSNTSTGTSYADTVSGGTLSSGTFYINTVSGGALSNGTFYANSMSAGTITNASNGTSFINTASGGTFNNGTFYVNTVTGGTFNNGTFYLANVSGGTFNNGVFYIDKLTGPVTSTNATLVVITSADVGNSTLNLRAPAANIGSADNRGLALVSPNAITIGFGGNGVLKGAIYAPNTSNGGSLVYMRGTVDASCAQVIAGAIDIGGNVRMTTDGTCGVTDITQGGSVRLAE